MSNRKMKGMFDILEEELRALIEVVVEVDPQAAETFNKNLREQVQKLRKVDQKMMDAMNANNAKLNALLKEKEALLAEKEVTLDRTKAMLAELKAELDARVAAAAAKKRKHKGDHAHV
jgi:septal ring factor EnvC (AmiA/AmiB activator)